MKWNKSNINYQSRFKLKYSCHRPDPKSRKLHSRFVFSKFNKIQDYSIESVETETFSRLYFFISRRSRLFDTANFQKTETFRKVQFWIFFKTETFRDSAKIVETETFLSLSLISETCRKSSK